MQDSTLRLNDIPQGSTPPASLPGAPPGFVLLDEVGRGGMGVVFRARDTALDREVAVKFLRDELTPDSDSAVRFVEEARITGQLQHPGVPAVHQVGALPNGRPFLAMKLIRGSTLDALLKRGASIDPLSIFESIAQAVGYAHAHGVVHRDLKPSNVMVGGFGEVQVMDWGLAKVLSSPRSETGPSTGQESTAALTRIRSPRDSDSGQTLAGSILGTPAFMSPEQAAGEIDRIDARSDVFGLGAILCALLTGQPPYVGRDVESVRLAAAGGRTEEAFSRLDASGADPDLVALCKRCLAFDPSDRPGSGDAVAAEMASLRRAADERARQAERDRLSAEVRAAEQSKRRRTAQWAAGVVVGVSLLGVAGTGVGLYRANLARRDAVRARIAAEVKRNEAETAREAETRQKALALAKQAEADAVVSFLEDQVLAAGRPKGLEGGLGSAVSLRDAILASLPTLEKAFTDQPLVEARLRRALGRTFLDLGEAQRAVEQAERARGLLTRHLGPDDPETLRSMNDLASGYQHVGRLVEALKLHEETLAASRRVLPPDHPITLTSMNNLANTHAALGHEKEALALRERTLAIHRRTLPPDHPITLRSMNNLAGSHAALGRHAEALALREETLAAARRVFPPDHPNTLMSMNNLATALAAVGRREEAVELLEETLAARKRVLPPDHPQTLMTMANLATNQAALGRYTDALRLREIVLEARKRVLPPDHPDTLMSMNSLADSHAALGRDPEALKLRESALAAMRRALPPGHPETLSTMVDVAESLVKLDRGAEAVPLIDDCLAKAAGLAGHPRLVPRALGLRLRHFRGVGDPAGCRATAEMLEKLERVDAAGLFRAARFRAVAAGVWATTGGTDSSRLARDEVERAMAWLTKAVAAGFTNRAQLERDPAFAPLRTRDDFKKLIAKLKEKEAR